MRKLTKATLIIAVIYIALACSKSETTVVPVAIKCANSTILDDIITGKQMYIMTKSKTQVLLNLKDKKGKARTIGAGINPVIYEWDITVSVVNETQVKLQAGNIIGVQGNFVAGVYFPDSFFFKDDNCKISGETNDGQTVYNNLILYEDITNSKDLPAILEKYLW